MVTETLFSLYLLSRHSHRAEQGRWSKTAFCHDTTCLVVGPRSGTTETKCGRAEQSPQVPEISLYSLRRRGWDCPVIWLSSLLESPESAAFPGFSLTQWHEAEIFPGNFGFNCFPLMFSDSGSHQDETHPLGPHSHTCQKLTEDLPSTCSVLFSLRSVSFFGL